jgi:hypothetical protein
MHCSSRRPFISMSRTEATIESSPDLNTFPRKSRTGVFFSFNVRCRSHSPKLPGSAGRRLKEDDGKGISSTRICARTAPAPYSMMINKIKKPWCFLSFICRPGKSQRPDSILRIKFLKPGRESGLFLNFFL